MIITNIEKYMREKVAVEFWSYFTKTQDEHSGFRLYAKAVEILYNYYIQFANIMANIDAMREYNGISTHIYNEKHAIDALKLIIRATLLAKLPVKHDNTIKNFYEIALRQEEGRENVADDETCKTCLLELAECNCIESFYETNRCVCL